MPTHSFQQGSGFKVTGGTGGVSGGGGLAGTLTIDEIQSETGSNEAGVQASQIGFANAPTSAGADSHVTLTWKLVGTNQCSLTVEDDSVATGETGTSDITASTRPVADRPPLLNNFEGATEEHYRYTASNTITKLKMDYEGVSITNAGGVAVPLRTLATNGIGTGSNSSGWITSSLSTGITLDIQQIISSLSDDIKTHVCDGIVKLYAGDSSNEGLLKQFRLRVYTHAVSTY
jgi:hypothetical protein